MEERKYTIDDVETLRSKTGISYEEAVGLLEKYDGDVARALIELEKRGQLGGNGSTKSIKIDVNMNAMDFLRKWWRKGCDTHIVVEHDGEELINLPVLFMILALLLGYKIMFFGAILALVLGCHVHVRGREEEQQAPAEAEAAQPEEAETADQDSQDDGFHTITIE